MIDLFKVALGTNLIVPGFKVQLHTLLNSVLRKLKETTSQQIQSIRGGKFLLRGELLTILNINHIKFHMIEILGQDRMFMFRGKDVSRVKVITKRYLCFLF